MLGSTNYVRFVYDGDGSASAPAGPPGSAQIESVFTRYFASQGLASEPTAFDGRSDYGPFIDDGVPAGGLFSGAEGEKTAEQAAIYGGTAESRTTRATTRRATPSTTSARRRCSSWATRRRMRR